MPSVFLSYSRNDLPLIEQLERQLKSSPEISIWRDQAKIYGGQKWPKVLGESIADQDVFLLVWSENSATSHFVEFEWTTAIALKKTIVPCMLDNTSLPPSLTATNAISITDPPKIVMALTHAGLAQDPGRRTAVVSKLDQITATVPEDVLKATKMLFDQRNWTVQGNVIQGETVTVHMGREPGKSSRSLAEKWQVWVGIVVGLLTAVTLAVELPKKLDPKLPHSDATSTMKAIDPEKLKLQLLIGGIRNEANDPLPDVQVSLPRFNLTKPTDQLGQFWFEVTASDQETVALLAQKPGYETYEADVTLGNTALGFTMQKKP